MRKKSAAVLCAAAAFLTMSGCKKAPPGTLTGISISYSGMCYDDTYGFSIRNDPADGCLFSCNYKDDEWVELENIPVEDTHWQEALALAEKLGLESLPDEKKNSSGLFITDETLNSVLPCGQSSPSNENGRYTAKAVLMIRQFRLRKKS